MTKTISIDIGNLRNAVTLSPAMVTAYAEAARVMLDNYHQSRERLEGLLVHDDDERPLVLLFDPPDEQMHASYANTQDATEYGAYAVAFGAAHKTEGYVVKKRAYHGSGADFLMVKDGESSENFVRLEVSGIGSPQGNLQTRLERKKSQLNSGDLLRPGVAVVVGFGAVRILMEDCPL